MDSEFGYTQITGTELDFHDKIAHQVIRNLWSGLESPVQLCALQERMKTAFKNLFSV